MFALSKHYNEKACFVLCERYEIIENIDTTIFFVCSYHNTDTAKYYIGPFYLERVVNLIVYFYNMFNNVAIFCS